MPLRKTRYRREPMTEINMTNLIDIMMVLLIVFILVSNFVQTSLDIELPKARYTETTGKQQIVVGIKAGGLMTLNGDPVTKENFQPKLLEMKEQYPDRRVFIHPDKFASVQDLVSVMSLIRLAGFDKVDIAAIQESGT